MNLRSCFQNCFLSLSRSCCHLRRTAGGLPEQVVSCDSIVTLSAAEGHDQFVASEESDAFEVLEVFEVLEAFEVFDFVWYR